MIMKKLLLLMSCFCATIAVLNAQPLFRFKTDTANINSESKRLLLLVNKLKPDKYDFQLRFWFQQGFNEGRVYMLIISNYRGNWTAQNYRIDGFQHYSQSGKIAIQKDKVYCASYNALMNSLLNQDLFALNSINNNDARKMADHKTVTGRRIEFKDGLTYYLELETPSNKRTEAFTARKQYIKI